MKRLHVEKQPGLHVPKTDVIASAVHSPAWSSAVVRSLIEPYPERQLAAFLSIEDLQNSLDFGRRQVSIVEVNVDNFEACCRLGSCFTGESNGTMLVGVTKRLTAQQRHALRASGFAAAFSSFSDLQRLRVMVKRFFATLPSPEMTIEDSVEMSLPWSVFQSVREST